MPGEISIANKEYYADNNNKYWDLIGLKYNMHELKYEDYIKKVLVLQSHNIGLWNILSSCTRECSNDKTIKNERFNDIHNLIKQYPNIKKIIINGKGAYDKYFKKFKIQKDIKIIPLTSTSGSHWDCQSFEKRNKWLLELPTIIQAQNL